MANFPIENRVKLTYNINWNGGGKMSDYEKAYILLQNAICDALNQIERYEILKARQILIKAQFEAKDTVEKDVIRFSKITELNELLD